MKILAIETSCDETAIALVEAKGGLKNPHFKILENFVASQIKIHRPFGGVVPNLAKREHIKNLPILYRKIFGIFKSKFLISKQISNPKSQIQKIDLIAVTVGPGLEPALWTGINFAKDLQRIMNDELRIKNRNKKPIIHNSKFIIPIIGVSHLEGHLHSHILENIGINKNKKPIIHNSKFIIQNMFPAIALLVSGGHTILIKMDSLEKYKKLGETRDDAVGEAFDKVARLLDLPYPGGPEIEKLAKYGSSTSIGFPRPMINQKNYDFSFSGLKTAVLYYLRDNFPRDSALSLRKSADAANIAASFQKAAFDVLIKKTLRAVSEFNAKSIFVSGGVAANKTLKKEFKKAINNLKPKTNPPAGGLKPNLQITKFPTDNAAMIAAAGYINFLKKKNRRLTANGNLTI